MSISLGTKIIGDFGAEVEIAEGVVVKETLSTTIETHPTNIYNTTTTCDKPSNTC